MLRVYTVSKILAEIAREQGSRAVRFIQCVKSRYSGVEARVCRELNAPPLISPRECALLKPTARGARPWYTFKRGPWCTLPWGEPVTGYRVPIAAYGLCRSTCNVILEDSIVIFTCYGVPDFSYVKPLELIGKRLGVEVKVAYTRLYDDSIVEVLAERIKRLRRIYVPERGSTHLILAALYHLVEYMGVSFESLPEILVGFDPSLASYERNIVKNAIDYMCAHGDSVACTASSAIHKPFWEKLARKIHTTYSMHESTT